MREKAKGGTGRNAMWDMPYAFVAILWLGVLLGVSFLATPVKFQAPSLDLPTALDVGRVTFSALARSEWGLFILLGISVAIGPRHRMRLVGLIVLAVILAMQALWLLPILDERVARIIAGASVPPSNSHLFYIASDIAKALVLLTLSIEASFALVRRRDAD